MKLLKRHHPNQSSRSGSSCFRSPILPARSAGAMFMLCLANMALIFVTFREYGDMQAAQIANKVFYCNAALLLAAYIPKMYSFRRDARADLEADSSAQNNSTADSRSSLQPYSFLQGLWEISSRFCRGPLDQIDHGTGIRRHLAGFGIGAGFAAWRWKNAENVRRPCNEIRVCPLECGRCLQAHSKSS